MSKINKVVDKILDIGLVIAVGTVFIVTFLQVVSRFLFKLPIPWSTDIIRLSFVYVVFLGSALGMREKGHLNVDVIFNALPKKIRHMVGIAINLVLLVFFVAIVNLGFKFAQSGLTQGSPYLELPMTVYYMSVPLSAALMFYYLIQHTIEEVKVFKKLK
ncbi:TRAP transporter small permease [Maledivibacter halophilus]|uniref:TRAP-type C4-dicarboxylate transport system, small permease component n=1 Tax=Maledivibacter halophilus TaxID=36842 RepID=A0A1T5MDF6_9FIRM|nr:TRAP transporter small permease [Maledivibacter halophilus]SKC86252.1 TRAP-type C4-dicarboxylate transport system, small permease component [Maledivibacter halophilus]